MVQVLSSVSFLLFFLFFFFCIFFSHTGCASCLYHLFFFAFFFFISSIEDLVAVIFLFKRESPKCVPVWQNLSKLIETPETHRNRLKFSPRWNKRVSHSGLQTSMRFFVRFGQNGMEFIALVESEFERVESILSEACMVGE